MFPCLVWSKTVITLGVVSSLTIIGAASLAAPPTHLYCVSQPSSTDERLMLLTLQGLVAQTKPEIWVIRSETERWLTDLKDTYDIDNSNVSSPWTLVDMFRSRINGYVLCEVGQPSQNVGASLAGLLGGIAVTPSLEPQMTSRGIPLLIDVRGQDDAWCFSNYGSQFAKDIAFEQKYDIPDLRSFLYDYATSRKAMIMYRGTDTQNQLRRDIAASLDDHSPVVGWAADTYEGNWVKDLSQSVTGGVAADAWHNGSVLSQVPVELPIKQRTHIVGAPATEDNVHYVSFIMTDGDNIQWLERTFGTSSTWWASGHRGNFNMGWEMNPGLLDHAPSILRRYYLDAKTATGKDYFISSPFGNLLMAPDYYPSNKLSEYAAQLAPYLTNADMSIVNVIMYSGSSSYYDRLNSVLDLPGVWGIVVKESGGNYAEGNGYIYWRNGKPAINYKYFIKPGVHTPSGVATALNGRPRSPKTNISSYTLVAVNAWNDDPMSDVAACKSQLDPAVKIVTPEELFYHLRKNFGTPVGPEGVSKIECEDYSGGDSAQQGIDYYDTTPGNSGGKYRTQDVDIENCSEGGYGVGWIAAGEWLRYKDVYVDRGGAQEFTLRASAWDSPKQVRVCEGSLDNTVLTLTIPVTGASQNWQTVSGVVSLSEGLHDIYLVADSSDFNMNWFMISPIIDYIVPNTFVVGVSPVPYAGDQVQITFSATDNAEGSGISHYEAKLNGEPWPESVTSPWIVSAQHLLQGLNTVQMRAYDHAGNYRDSAIRGFLVDSIPPASFAPSVVPPRWTDESIGISFSTTDDRSGISRYEGKIDSGEFVTRTSPWTIPADVLSPGSHTITIRAYDYAGNYTDSTVQAHYAQEAARIDHVKALPDGEVRSLKGKVVTYCGNGFFYISEADRTSGIRVNSPQTVSVGDIVELAGVVRGAGAERYIECGDNVVFVNP